MCSLYLLHLSSVHDIYLGVNSTNDCVAPKFFPFTTSVIQRIVRIWECGSIPSKAVCIFLKSFLNFGLDTIEKQSIINLSCNNSKSHVSIVLNDSVVAYLGKGTDITFLGCVLFINCVA